MRDYLTSNVDVVITGLPMQADPGLLRAFLQLLRRAFDKPGEIKDAELSALSYEDMSKPERKTKLVVEVWLLTTRHAVAFRSLSVCGRLCLFGDARKRARGVVTICLLG
jgi:hypothetical protein